MFRLSDPLVPSSGRAWLLAGLPTVDNLRRGIVFIEALSDICVLCGKERETINHLFLHCEFSSFLWCHVICRSGVQWCSPESGLGMVEARSMALFLVVWPDAFEGYPLCHFMVSLERKEC